MDDRWVDVSHEALIRAWPRLRKWIDEDRAGLRLHRQITEAAEAWQRLNRDEGALFRGARLGQTLEWREHNDGTLNPLERDFLDASTRLRDDEIAAKERQRRRQLLALASVAVVALGATIVIGTLWQQSRLEARNATARATIGSANLWRSRAIVTADGWPDALQRSVLFAVEARRRLSTPDSEQALRASVDLLGQSTRSFELAAIPVLGPDGATIVAISIGSPVVQIVDVANGRVRARMNAAGAVRQVVFSPSATLLALVTEPQSGDGPSLEVHTLSDGRALWTHTIADPDGFALRVPAYFSPDSSAVAVVEGQRAVVFDARTGAERASIAHANTVTGVAFSADGSRLATGSTDRTARVTVLATGGATDIKHDEEIHGVALAPDARLLLTLSKGDADVFDVSTGRRIAHQSSGRTNESPLFARFSTDGGSFGVVGEYATASTWSVAASASLWSLDRADNEALGSLESTNYVGKKSKDAIEVWDITTGRIAARVLHRPGTEKVEAISFHGPSGRLAFGDGERIWIYETGPASDVTHRAYEGERRKLLRSLDLKSVAIVAGSRIDVWDVGHASPGPQLSAAGPIADAGFSVDGRFLIARTETRLAQIWDLSSSREVWRAEGVVHAALNRTGTLVATAGSDSTIRMRALPAGNELWHQGGVPATVEEEDSDGDDRTVANIEHASFSRDGRFFSVRLRKSGTRVWDTESGRESGGNPGAEFPDWEIPLGTKVLSAARTKAGITVWNPSLTTALSLSHGGGQKFFLNADGSRMATVASDHVRLWSAGSDRPAGEITDKANVQEVALSPDGAFAATVTWGPSVRLFAIDGATLRATVTHDAGATEQDNGVSAAEFSPDSRYLVTAGADNTARVWDVRTGSEAARLNHDAPVGLAAFSADGRYITTWSDTGQLRVWLWRDTDLIAKACERLTRNLTLDEWRSTIGGGYSKTCPDLP